MDSSLVATGNFFGNTFSKTKQSIPGTDIVNDNVCVDRSREFDIKASHITNFSAIIFLVDSLGITLYKILYGCVYKYFVVVF